MNLPFFRLKELDVYLKRSVFSAVSILCVLFLLCMISRIVVFVFFGLTFIASMYLGYDLFIREKRNERREKQKEKDKERIIDLE